MEFYKSIIFISITLFLLSSCNEGSKKVEDYPAYEGPSMEVDSSTILYSDSAVVRIKVDAPKQFEFENGDKEFPNTIFIEFYEPDGSLSSTLAANTAFYNKETDLYHAVGDVEVIGYLEPQKLNSEELFWDPKKEEIYTETFVKIETEDQISTGTGLTAKQDFSTYRILNPKGTIYMEEDDQNTTPNVQGPKKGPIKKPRKKIVKRNVKKEN